MGTEWMKDKRRKVGHCFAVKAKIYPHPFLALLYTLRIISATTFLGFLYDWLPVHLANGRLEGKRKKGSITFCPIISQPNKYRNHLKQWLHQFHDFKLLVGVILLSARDPQFWSPVFPLSLWVSPATGMVVAYCCCQCLDCLTTTGLALPSSL